MIKEMTVKGVEDMFKAMRRQKMITGRTKILLSSDEEGNHFSPMIMIDGKYNVAIDDEEDKLILYPA